MSEDAKVPEQQEKPAAESASPAREPAAAQQGEMRPEDPKSADDVLTKKMPGEATKAEATAAADAGVLAASRRRTRRSFLIGGVAAVGAYGFYHWLDYGPHRDMLPTLVDRAYDANAAISRGVFREHALAPTYPLNRAETLRVNGVFGLKKTLKPETWRLQLVGASDAERHPQYVKDVTAWEYGYQAGESHDDQGHDTKTDPSKQSSIKMAPAPMLGKTQADENKSSQDNGSKQQDQDQDQQKDAQDDNQTGRKPRGLEEAGESDSTLEAGTPGLLLTLNDFLPHLKRYEMVTQFKCIEGWSQIVHWAGVRFADFLEMFPPALVNGREPRYVYMETPDGDYYVGYDLHVLRHPQTLLVTEMMGAPLTQSHGAPLRLHTPTKYGYKQIKRIGLIAYTDDKPDDYWTKLGYDWYAGL
ncbi:molybdopterin-dependent oxidoreductase [Terriglobus sp.]|uniref:molybdopterin-dependent oxidoreductase n=1 Tax=Terriglobus sp. TaxID=1889013 RepID=UPI003B00C96B